MLRYVVDEQLRGTMARVLVILARRQGFELDVLQVGDLPDLPLGIEDPDLIRWAEASERVIISLEVSTLPDHLANHLNAGRHSPGIFVVLRPLNIAVADWLVLLAYASDPTEWRDSITFVPL